MKKKNSEENLFIVHGISVISLAESLFNKMNKKMNIALTNILRCGAMKMNYVQNINNAHYFHKYNKLFSDLSLQCRHYKVDDI